jgi:hypothetical protein
MRSQLAELNDMSIAVKILTSYFCFSFFVSFVRSQLCFLFCFVLLDS